MKLVPYFAKNTCSWQIECRAIINLHFGGTIMGLALMPAGCSPFKRRWWTRIFPLIEIKFNVPTTQARKYLFKIRAFGKGIHYKTKGESTEYGYQSNGLCFC